ncbi:MAG: NACHT domain-containing protein, partial [Pseudomonadota bacterium]|nr:NACHT domain-containing protein [Pseudomonadota bacterium]
MHVNFFGSSDKRNHYNYLLSKPSLKSSHANVKTAAIQTKDIDAQGYVNAVAVGDNSTIELGNVKAGQNLAVVALGKNFAADIPDFRNLSAVFIARENSRIKIKGNVVINNEKICTREDLLHNLFTCYLRQQNAQPLLKVALQYYVPLDASLSPVCSSNDFRANQYQSLHDLYIKPFFSNQQPLMLLLGDSGSGKSTYGHYLASDLWTRCLDDGDAYIPIVIEFKSLSMPKGECNVGRFIETVLKEKYLLNEREILLLKNYKVAFILDGYDEKKGADYSFYADNHLADWNAKVLVTCRRQHLAANPNYRHDFSGKDHFTSHEVYIVPFDRQKIDAFLVKVVNDTGPLFKVYNLASGSEWTLKRYQETFIEYPQLYELVENPLLLRMVVLALPRMMLNLNYEKTLLEKHERVIFVPKFTSVHIYQAFIEDWYEREAQRYYEKTGQGKVKLWDFKMMHVKRAFGRFCQTLAWEMLLNNQAEVKYQNEEEDVSEDETED